MALAARLLLFAGIGIGCVGACSKGTACHYGKHWKELTDWLVEQDLTGATCHDAFCTDRRVQLLLSHEPTGCEAATVAKWTLLKEHCHQIGGVCCGGCELAHSRSCDTGITDGDQFDGAIYATFAALLAVAALQWGGNPPPLASAPSAPRQPRMPAKRTNWEF